MAELKVKTRMNATANGKKKVYFGCHPEDFKYFEELSNDILKVEDAGFAIFYYEPSSGATDEERTDSLLHCALYVCPVTKKFLNDKNAAFELEIKTAIKNNIRILPIVLEEGLEVQFDKIFGSVHCLVKQEGYEARLENFIRETVYTKKMVKKIRSAFDGYIFLSYRKKDREALQRFIKKLHNTEALQGLGIWYDDYLVPGENFDDSILKVMEESLFVVVNVTPNLLTEENYVKTIENPYAVENNIPVYFIETEPTDHEELKKQFPNADTVYGIQNVGQILSQAYKKTVKNPSESTPERLYLLALAYFSGINVEVNRELGEKLMRRSANSGYTEALEYLLRNGMVSGNKKIEMIKKLKRERWFIYAESEENKAANMASYLNAVFLLANELVDTEKYEESFMYYQEIVRKSRYHSKSAYLKSYSYNAQRGMAQAYIAWGKKEKAEKLFIKLTNEIKSYPRKNEPVIRNLHSELLNEMAAFYVSEGRTKKAESCYRRAIEIADDGLSNENKAFLQMRTHRKAGINYVNQNDYKNAEKEFNEYLKIMRDYIVYHNGEQENSEYLDVLMRLWKTEVKLVDRKNIADCGIELFEQSEAYLKMSEAYLTEHINILREMVRIFIILREDSLVEKISKRIAELSGNDMDKVFYQMISENKETKKPGMFSRLRRLIFEATRYIIKK